jgi:hypothetical protein
VVDAVFVDSTSLKYLEILSTDNKTFVLDASRAGILLLADGEGNVIYQNDQGMHFRNINRSVAIDLLVEDFFTRLMPLMFQKDHSRFENAKATV